MTLNFPTLPRDKAAIDPKNFPPEGELRVMFFFHYVHDKITDICMIKCMTKGNYTKNFKWY